jgi:hypothetical protein
MSRTRYIKLADCSFSSVKFKKSPKGKKSGGFMMRRSPAMNEIIKLTDKKKRVLSSDVDEFMTNFPLSSLSAVEVSALVRSLGRTKYNYDSSQLTQLTSALNSAELKLNAKCLGE